VYALGATSADREGAGWPIRGGGGRAAPDRAHGLHRLPSPPVRVLAPVGQRQGTARTVRVGMRGRCSSPVACRAPLRRQAGQTQSRPERALAEASQPPCCRPQKLPDNSPSQATCFGALSCLCTGSDGRVSALGSPAGLLWRRRQARHRRPAAETPSPRIAQAGAKPRSREPTGAWSPEPGHLMGGALGDEGGPARPESSRRTEAECLWREIARVMRHDRGTACGRRSRSNACRSIPARRVRRRRPLAGGRPRGNPPAARFSRAVRQGADGSGRPFLWR
jgi:hypothetical protein